MIATKPKGFPDYLEPLKQLVNKHLSMDGEALLLVGYYNPERKEQKGVFLLEVLEGFGHGEIEPDNEFMEVSFTSSEAFPLEEGQRFHLTMTNPQEFRRALEAGWFHAKELKEAIEQRRLIWLYSHATRGAELKALLEDNSTQA